MRGGALFKGDVHVCTRLTVSANGCDFVFADDYKKLSWKEKEEFYKLNKRLPYVEPAAKMEENGLDVGANFSGMLRNIEEDRLDITELYMKIENLEKQNAILVKNIEELKGRYLK